MSQDLLVGAAEVDITPPVGTLLAGSLRPRTSKGIADPLYVKAVALESNGVRLVYVSLDLIQMEKETAAPALALASKATGIPEENILWGASHTHSGPYMKRRRRDYLNQAWLAELPDKFAECVKEADACKVPARLSRCRGYHYGVGHNRRLSFKDGRQINTWLLNKGEDELQCVGSSAPIDPEIGILALEDMRGRVLAVLFQFALHANVHFGIEFSADYPGVVAQRMKERFGPQVVTLYHAGACGDINTNRKGYKEIGNALADVIIDRIEKRKPFDCPIVLGASKRRVVVPYRDLTQDQESRLEKAQWGEKLNDIFRQWQKEIRDEGTTEIETTLQAWHIGDTSFLSLPGEVFVEWGLKIKRDGPFPWTFPVELGGDNLGYLVTRSAYEAGGYEGLLSWSARIDVAGVALMVDRGLEMLRKLYKDYTSRK